MFGKLFCLFALLSIVAALNVHQEAFNSWMRQHNKVYQVSDFALRFKLWSENRDYIEKFNAEEHTFKLAMNEFGDLSNEEFKKLLGTKPKLMKLSSHQVHTDTSDLPDSLDWRTKGVVTPIKDQGQCGSCWSFSTTGSVEGAWALAKGSANLVSLSEQNLIDCSTPQGNQGCDGGLMDDAFQYIITNNGIDTEKSYPYTAADGKCQFNSSNIGAKISAYKDVPSGDEGALQQAVALGPVSVAMDASQISFQFYSSGVYWSYFCSSTELDHGVLAVGWGVDTTSDVPDYWIVKNSWGTSWGQSGYFWLARNDGNMCGVATASSYPIV